MTRYLDHYCERLAPGFWAEPLNLITNAAFLIAAIIAVRAYRRSQEWTGKEWDFWLLALLLFAIGIGSGLWHLHAEPWALKADRYPILLFINIYLLSCLFRVLRAPISWGLAAFITYHIVNRITQSQLPSDFLNGSVFYAPTWLFLLGITLLAWRQSTQLGRVYAWATGLFTLSLIFRTIDLQLCAIFPWGTHFLWHLLNALVLYLLFIALLRSRQHS